MSGPTLAERWRAQPRGRRALLVAAGLVLAANVLAAGARTATGGGAAGPPSSSYSTAPEGLSAFAALLAERGHPVRRSRAPLDDADLDPASTLVVADPAGMSPDDSDAAVGFVAGGGRLVLAGPTALPLAQRFDPALDWRPGGPDTVAPPGPPAAAEVRGVREVRTGGAGRFIGADEAGPLLAGPGPGPGAFAVAVDAGKGRVVALAGSVPLQNRTLAAADNAAFALRLAGEATRPVVFAEATHGYGESDGLVGPGVLPGRWPGAVGLAAAAALVWAWSAGHRLGPPEDDPDTGPPPRREYVDAMAALLARSGRPAEATAALRDRARRRLAARLGVGDGAADAEIRRAAQVAGWDEALVDAVLIAPGGEPGVLALGRAAAVLEDEGGRLR